MKKVVEKTLIAKDINRTSSLVISGSGDNIAEGEIVVLDKDKNIMTAGATIADTDTIYIVEGLGNTYDYVTPDGTSVADVRDLLYSDPIEGKTVTNWAGTSYSVAAEEVWSIDLTGWVPVVGTEYIIKIVYKDLTPDYPGMYSHTYHYIAGTATLDTEGAAIAALINKDKKRRVDVTYTTGTDVLAFTGKVYSDTLEIDTENDYAQVNFEVFMVSDNFDTYTTSAQTTAPSPGSGTYKLVRDEEKWQFGYNGLYNRTGFPRQIPTTRTVKSETYDTLVIEHKNWYTSVENRLEQADLTTKLFVPNTATSNQMTDILAVLNPWMASLPSAFDTVSV